MSDLLDKLNNLEQNLELLSKKIDSTSLENALLKNQQTKLVSEKSDLIKKNEAVKSKLKALLDRIDNIDTMEKTKVDINILGQDISVMCTEDEKHILLKSREKILEEAEKVKEKTKNVGHDYFLVLFYLILLDLILKIRLS